MTLPPEGAGDPGPTKIISVTVGSPSAPPPPPGSPPASVLQETQQQITIPVNLLPQIYIDTPANLVEASDGNAGIATAVAAVTKSDLNVNDSASYDTAALVADKWDDLGNGVFGKLGSYGAATLNTVGVATAVLLANGWTNLGSGVFEKMVVLHDANGNPFNELVRVNTAANTLTYALDNTKADALTGNAFVTEQFIVRVVDENGGHNQNVATFTVEGTNDAPVAVDDTYTVALGQTLHVPANGIFANDQDAEGDPLSASLQSIDLISQSGGTFSLVGGSTSVLRSGFGLPDWTNPDGIGIGSTIQVFDSHSPSGQGLFLSGPSLVTFTFLGSEAGYTDAAYFDGQNLFFNHGTAVGTTVGDLNADAGLLELLFRSLTPGDKDAVNGGPIDPSVLLGYALAGDNRAYAFFDDVASGDRDFDDMVVRIDLQPVVQTTDGLLTFNSDGSFDFRPFFAGTATFTYKVNDGTVDSANTATVTIDVPTGSETFDFASSGIDTQVVLSDAPGASFYNAASSGQQSIANGTTNVTGGLGDDSISGTNSGGILNGGSGNDLILGGTGNDIVIGGAGNDQLTGNGGDDYFVFRLGFGHDAITDFSVGDAAHHDVLDLRGLGFTSIMDVLNHTDDGGNAVIHVGGDDITLVSVTKAMLASNTASIMFA